jgi:HEAT repeat protein
MRRKCLGIGACVLLCLLPGGRWEDASAQEGAVPAALWAALESADPDERDRAVAEIVAKGRAAVPELTAVLRRGSSPRAASVLLCLERIGDFRALDAIYPFLALSKRLDERLYALRALGRLGNPTTKKLLKKYLAYEAPDRLDEKVVGWIAGKSKETEQGLIRNQAAESLARLGDCSGVPQLVDNLESNGWVRRDALIRLRRITGCKVDFGYNLGASRRERKVAVDAWKDWWEENRAGFSAAWTDSHKVFDVNKRGG